MKRLIILSILLIFCVACGCIGSEQDQVAKDGNAELSAQTEIMTVYDKAIVYDVNKVVYIVVFVDKNGNVFNNVGVEDPGIYTNVEIGCTYELEIRHVLDNHLTISKIVECDQMELS